ncbi:hypothetical protein V3C99_015541 [Haemonchus contortus]
MGPSLGIDGKSGNEVPGCELPQPLVDQVDPLQCVLFGESVGSDDDLRDKPASSRGFGLLPYLRKQKLHEGCTPQIDDFSVENLRLTPHGCGEVPSRQSVNDENDIEVKKSCSSTFIKDGFSIEDIGPEEDLESSLTAMKSFDENSRSLLPTPETSVVVCNKEFRNKCADQAKVFLDKCKEKKWVVDEMSNVDYFMDKLHSQVNDMNERLAQIELFSRSSSIDTLQFLRTVFGSRPFFDINRSQVTVDEWLNTFFTYPQTMRETVTRKSFNSYVESLREKIRAKREAPLLYNAAPEPLSTAVEAKSSEDSMSLETAALTCVPNNADSSSIKQMRPSYESESPEKILIESNDGDTFTSLAKPSSSITRHSEMIPSSRSASCDVLTGIITEMDKFEATMKPAVSEDEELDDVPFLSTSDNGECDPPQAKRQRYEDDLPSSGLSDKFPSSSTPTKHGNTVGITASENEVPGLSPVIPEPNLRKETMPPTNAEKSNVAFFSRARTTFTNRQSVHADVFMPPNLSRYPLNVGKAFDSHVKRMKAEYDEDPYIRTSTSGIGKSPFTRPIKKTTLETSIDACTDDPFYMCSVKKEAGECDGRNGARISSADNFFRATFSSLNDPVSRRLAPFDLRKSRTKWKLVPVPDEELNRANQSAPMIDPRRKTESGEKKTIPTTAANDDENEVGGVRATCFRRCITERSSSNVRPRLALRGNCRRTSYEPTLLSVDEQFLWNKQKELQPLELDMIRAHVIPRWGSANPKRSKFPFDKTEGMFWPIVQPYDAIDIEDVHDVATADTKNQLVCLTELTFAARRQLLCGRNDRFHFKRYMRAIETDESKWQQGRFQHRVGYMRVFMTQSLDDARLKDQEQQRREAAWMGRLVDVETMRIKTESNSLEFQKANQPNSLSMSEHIDFNLCDLYSKKREKSYRDQSIPIHLRKGTRSSLKVPRDWLEAKIEYYMPTSQRKDYLCSYINYCNKLTVQNVPKAKEPTDETVQYHLNAIKVIFIHQWGYKGIGMNSLFSKETQQKMSQRLQSIFSEISAEKVSVNALAELCELQDWEERYWTIIWDNLASSFLYAPPFSQLKLGPLIAEAFNQAAAVPQRPEYCGRFWQVVEKLSP